VAIIHVSLPILENAFLTIAYSAHQLNRFYSKDISGSVKIILSPLKWKAFRALKVWTGLERSLFSPT
jgi:hypothetical protein